LLLSTNCNRLWLPRQLIHIRQKQSCTAFDTSHITPRNVIAVYKSVLILYTAILVSYECCSCTFAVERICNLDRFCWVLAEVAIFLFCNFSQCLALSIHGYANACFLQENKPHFAVDCGTVDVINFFKCKTDALQLTYFMLEHACNYKRSILIDFIRSIYNFHGDMNWSSHIYIYHTVMCILYCQRYAHKGSLGIARWSSRTHILLKILTKFYRPLEYKINLNY
jgi:hypothetical protein